MASVNPTFERPRLGPARRRSLDAAFDPRRNSLNFLRLAFAALVIVSHSPSHGGFGPTPRLGQATLGDVAVDAFFAMSGFLIAASGARTGVLRFLWQRVLRIFPAFWVCLLVTAVVFGPVGWLEYHQSLSGYFGEAGGPIGYVTHNFTLVMRQLSINGTLDKVPYPVWWDGSLWTLGWEFLCYLGIAGLALCGLLRRRALVLVAFVAVWGLEWAHYLLPQLHTLAKYNVVLALRFAPIFLAGTLVYLYRDRIPDSRLLALASAVLVAVGVTLSAPDMLAGPALAYFCMWLGIHLPLTRVGARNDLSYGVYIWAAPVAQVLALIGVIHWGLVPFTLLTMLGVVPLAAASWWGVERHALRLKRWTPQRKLRPATLASATEEA